MIIYLNKDLKFDVFVLAAIPENNIRRNQQRFSNLQPFFPLIISEFEYEVH